MCRHCYVFATAFFGVTPGYQSSPRRLLPPGPLPGGRLSLLSPWVAHYPRRSEAYVGNEALKRLGDFGSAV